MRFIKYSFLLILVLALLTCVPSVAFAHNLSASSSGGTCVVVPNNTSVSIKEEKAYKTLYIKKGHTVKVEAPLTVTGNIYVVGNLAVSNKLTVNGNIYCLQYNSKKAGNYSYGKVYSSSSSSRIPSDKVKVTDSFLSMSVPTQKHGPTRVVGYVEPTCTTSGQSGTPYCKDCGDALYTYGYLEPLGHNWDKGVVTEEPTLAKQGMLMYSCSRCDNHKYDTIPNTDIIINAIDSIGTPTIADADTISMIRSSYDSLSDDQKALVPNYDAFIVAESQIEVLKETSIAHSTISMDLSVQYNGEQQTPVVKVVGYKGNVLVEGVDYSVSYKNNVNAGTGVAIVNGMGSFSGNKSTSFKIQKAPSTISIAAQSKVYTGDKLVYNGKVNKSGSTGAVNYIYYSDPQCTQYANPVNAGIYYVKASLATDSNYLAASSPAAKFTITKANNKLSVKSTVRIVKHAKLKKKSQTVAPITVKNAIGTRNFNVSKWTTAKAKKYFKINVKNGKVIVKKGTPKGTYKFKVKVTAKGNANFKPSNKTIALTIKVK